MTKAYRRLARIEGRISAPVPFRFQSGDLIFRRTLRGLGKKESRKAANAPFAEYGHMVQKTPSWMANDAEGQEKQEITTFKKLVSFLFIVPLRRLPSSNVIFIPCAVYCKGPIATVLLNASLSTCNKSCEENILITAHFHVFLIYRMPRVSKNCPRFFTRKRHQRLWLQ